MVIGQNLTQRRKGAKKTENEYMVAAARDSCSSLSKNPLRLSALA
jgi:hypothetical protein